ncbi:hypothetical protein [Micromonospora sp. WMMC273]|uniref:hypothetical protein n=1 Tax=Micromonospora sp. WMMC273 TaxID=3015157 RepID=UPI0022B72959|nr:hypothetical protein [Micromonospora sp. WMMC273]MCZ7477014.1 hypothetical protein [Micromonospora sp. WMMC273]
MLPPAVALRESGAQPETRLDLVRPTPEPPSGTGPTPSRRTGVLLARRLWVAGAGPARGIPEARAGPAGEDRHGTVRPGQGKAGRPGGPRRPAALLDEIRAGLGLSGSMAGLPQPAGADRRNSDGIREPEQPGEPPPYRRFLVVWHGSGRYGDGSSTVGR